MHQAIDNAKTSIVNIRVTSSEKHQIISLADEAALSVSAYIRDKALNDETKSRRNTGVSRAEKTQIALILAQLGFIMDSIRGQEQTPFLDELSRHLLSLRDDCVKALSKNTSS